MGTVVSINVPNLITIPLIVLAGYLLLALFYQVVAVGFAGDNQPQGAGPLAFLGTMFNRSAVGR